MQKFPLKFRTLWRFHWIFQIFIHASLWKFFLKLFRKFENSFCNFLAKWNKNSYKFLQTCNSRRKYVWKFFECELKFLTNFSSARIILQIFKNFSEFGSCWAQKFQMFWKFLLEFFFMRSLKIYVLKLIGKFENIL